MTNQPDLPAAVAASVVLPTHGRRASLLRVLQALGRQNTSPGAFEVVVICDGDLDGSAAACRALAPDLPFVLRVYEQTNQGPAPARNRGVMEARAPLIIFLDDDVVPDEQLIATHLEAHANQRQCVTIGPLLPPPDVRLNAWGAWEENALCCQYADMVAGRWQPTYRQFYTGNAAVLKQHIVEVGGFNAAFRRAEDIDLALRLHHHGLHFVFLPRARGWHYVQRSFAAWVHMPAQYGAADVAMARAGHPEILARVAHEYRGRNRAVRLVTYLCAGRPTASRATARLLGLIARSADLIKVPLLGNLACSLVFNFCYYDSLAATLGGRAALMELLHGVGTSYYNDG